LMRPLVSMNFDYSSLKKKKKRRRLILPKTVTELYKDLENIDLCIVQLNSIHFESDYYFHVKCKH
jgi:hypothetical protein